MGFCCNVLSLNDFIDQSDQSTGNNEPTRVQTGDDDTSLFPAKPSSHLGPVLEKQGSQKGVVDVWVSFHPTDVVNLAW